MVIPMKLKVDRMVNILPQTWNRITEYYLSLENADPYDYSTPGQI